MDYEASLVMRLRELSRNKTMETRSSLREFIISLENRDTMDH
jgi:hypothetical protein